MKHILICFAIFGISINLYAQDETPAISVDTVWKTGGLVSLNFSQAYYENWTAGGTPSVNGVGFVKLFATYTKSKWRWDTQLELAYGLIQERQALQKKTDDKINFDTKIGYDMGKLWYAALLGTFKTQFTPAYEDPNIQLVKISDFMSPAYVIISLGLDHNPNENLSFFFAPLSMKSTIVLDDKLANSGAFGVQAGEWETIVRDSTSIDSSFIAGKNIRYEIGAYLNLQYKAHVWDNVDFETKLELYANYLDNFGNIDVNWEGLLNMKVNNFLSANIRVAIIYDDDIAIPTYVDDQGYQYYGARMQLKQLFGVGLNYKF